MIAAMDDAVGVILRALEESGTRENTLVLMSSDNGPSRESRNWLDGEEVSYTGGSSGGLRGSKGSVFEGGIRVPGIVSWPARLPAGAEFDQVGVMMDVLPTVLHAVDGTAPALTEVDGISLLDALSDENQELPERSVIWTYQGQYAVRQGRYKLVEDAREGMDPPATVERALYDLEADPQESVDISAQAPEVVLALEQELTDYRQAATRWEHEHELEPS